MQYVSVLERDAEIAPRPAARPPRSVPTASRRPSIAINGRFLSQSVTGVQRVCRAVVREIDRLLDHEFDVDVVLIHPPGADPASLALRNIRTETVGRGHGAQWEQLTLRSRSGTGRCFVSGTSLRDCHCSAASGSA